MSTSLATSLYSLMPGRQFEGCRNGGCSHAWLSGRHNVFLKIESILVLSSQSVGFLRQRFVGSQFCDPYSSAVLELETSRTLLSFVVLASSGVSFIHRRKSCCMGSREGVVLSSALSNPKDRTREHSYDACA